MFLYFRALLDINYNPDNISLEQKRIKQIWFSKQLVKDIIWLILMLKQETTEFIRFIQNCQNFEYRKQKATH
jgi:hypothetical protein